MKMVAHDYKPVNINTVWFGKIGEAFCDDVLKSVVFQNVLPLQTSDGQKLGMFFWENSLLLHQHKINESTCYLSSSCLLVSHRINAHAQHQQGRTVGRSTITKYFDQRQQRAPTRVISAKTPNVYLAPTRFLKQAVFSPAFSRPECPLYKFHR